MSEQTTQLLYKFIEQAELQLGFYTIEDLYTKMSSSRFHIAKSAFSDPAYPVDALYFSGNMPVICFKQLRSLDPEKISGLHRKVWNEGIIPFLMIVTSQEIRVYDCFDTPKKESGDFKKLEIECFQNTKNDLDRLCSLLHQSKIDSGIIWKEDFGKHLKTHNRVDRKLIDNLAAAREKLFGEKYNFPLDIIHDLLGRSLFTLYLEDRKILTAENYPSRPHGVNNFFDILGHCDATYALFSNLKEKFNGDLFPVTEKEKHLVKKHPQCLDLVKQCFSGHVEISTGQYSLFWRMFQFQYIPIELISSIYEEFISEEDDNQKSIKKDGAFYTPLMLVEFILNEVLPWPDNNIENQRYDLKILDPACGSGIFLVESYKRLIARWRYVHPNKEISEKVLTTLLRNSIYGIEKNPEAIKVTAFSLYLTLLNYLEPKKVLYQVKFEPLIGWKGKNVRERSEQKQGNNLFQSSTFNKELIDINNTEFDLIVGNPPWKSGKLDADVTAYCKKNKLPAQIACAYLHFMPQLAKKGLIALIGTAKILFNTGGVHEMFRKYLFTENCVEVIVNFSVVRDILFKNASTPGAVFIYKNRDGSVEVPFRDTVTYCVPKNIEIIKNRQTIVIDASEIKHLPIGEIIKENSKIFKIAMWGSVRDLRLVENKIRIVKPIEDFISKEDWGNGLIKDSKAKKGNLHLSNFPFIHTISKYYTKVENKEFLGNKHKLFRINNKKIFEAPIILVNEGTKDSEFCCSYVDRNAVFLSSIVGISIKSKNEKFHKALVACLNSSIAYYYYFITGSSWGIDKGGRILKSETVSFPALPFAMDEKTINQLSEKIDKIITIKKSNDLEIIQTDKATIKKIQIEIDEIIYKELNLNSNEISIINDVLHFSIALHNKYKDSGAECPVSPEKELTAYSKALIKTINSFFKGTTRSTWVEIITEKKQNDTSRIIALHFDTNAANANGVEITSHSISSLLKSINELTYQSHSESIYYRKVIKYYKKDVIYLIKPNQKRFWSISQALNDADDILTDLLKK